MLGVWLGIVVTTLLLPVGYIYLRANTNRPSLAGGRGDAAPRIAMLLGRFAADAAVLLGTLGTLTWAGWFLGWLMVSGPYSPWQIAYPLWLIAAPPLIALAALRILFDALPWLRGALGDLAYFVLWVASIAMRSWPQTSPRRSPPICSTIRASSARWPGPSLRAR